MNEDQPRPVDWNHVKRTMGLALLVAGIVSGGATYFFWGARAVVVDEVVILCLASGFWITERLVGIFTLTRKANPTAILLLFTGKLAWWATLIVAARRLPPGLDGAVGLGMGAFLLALVAAMLRHYGMPRISEGNPPRAP
jgi:hypothetical protein